MKKVKILIIIIIILLIYGLLMFFLFNKKDDSKKTDTIIETEENYYIALDVDDSLKYNGKWTDISSDSITSYNGYYKVYNESYSYLGDYKLNKGKKWILFDRDNNYVSYNGNNVIAYSDNFNVTFNKTKSHKLTNSDKELLERDFDIINYDYLRNEQVYDIDLDKNGQIDKIICLDNTNISSNTKPLYYNLFIIILNNQIYSYVNEKSDEAMNNYYEIALIFNYNNLGYDSIVLREVNNCLSDDATTNLKVYELKGNRYE